MTEKCWKLRWVGHVSELLDLFAVLLKIRIQDKWKNRGGCNQSAESGIAGVEELQGEDKRQKFVR